MEEGSLVREALQYMQQIREGGTHAGLQNALWIDAFLLEKDITAPTSRSFQNLATVCNDLNASLQKTLQSYPWHMGGDGPVFGVHVSSGRCHLRAFCRYGANVDDEWVAIAAVLHLSKMFRILAFQCWDLDDGHVLLIESALHLPPWVDEIAPSACRYRCWIQQGCITLIRAESPFEEQLTLSAAIERLLFNKGLEQPSSAQAAVEKRIRKLHDAIMVIPPNWTCQMHTSSLVLPRQIANLIRYNPQLVNCAVTVFGDMAHSQQPPGMIHYSDLVWTSFPFAKTSYAMLRTMVTPVWTAEDFIPLIYKGIETTLMKRACEVESTPHLAHALKIGVRLTAGFDYILAQKEPILEEVTPQDRIMKHWANIDIACGRSERWLQQAFQAGPNHAAHDLAALMTCPLYDVDLNEHFPCPLSRPKKQLPTIVKQQLRLTEVNESFDFSMPSPDDIDDDLWMQFTEEDLEREHGARQDEETHKAFTKHNNSPANEEEEQQEALTTILHSFQGFVETKSEVDGVSHDVANDSVAHTIHYASLQDDTTEINPRVFMHLLHKVLRSSPEEIREMKWTNQGDPYFSDDDDEESDHFKEDEQVVGLMNAMDDELYERGHMAKKRNGTDNNIKVLSNLLESLDVSNGGPGPVQNILKEMGIEPPDFSSEKGLC